MSQLFELIFKIFVAFIVAIIILLIIWGLAEIVIAISGVTVTNPYGITTKDAIFAAFVLSSVGVCAKDGLK